jgi:hypothetical protein
MSFHRPKLRYTPATLLPAAVALSVALALSPATARAKVIHEKLASFSGAEAPGGPFGPLLSSDAVDPASGDVYVLESDALGVGQNVIDKFDASGKYAVVQLTGAKITGQETFAFGLFSGLAVDGSPSLNKGDLYVADTNHGVVDRFSAAGKFICEITGKKPVSAAEIKHECNGVEGSVTPDGSITPAGVAVGASGDVLVADDAHSVVDEFGENGQYLGQIKDSHLTGEMGTIAIDSEGNLYVANVTLSGGGGNIIKFKPDGSFAGVIDPENPLSVAVDPKTGHVYGYNNAGSFDGEHEQIAEYEASGALVSAIATPGVIGLGLAVDGESGKLYAAEVSNGTVSIYSGDIVVPTVTPLPATPVTETTATLHAHIDPDATHGGGQVSECVFEYGESTTYGNTAPCSPSPPYSTATDVSADISSLTRASTYHFRVKAENANGTSESEDQTFTSGGAPVIDSQASRVSGTTAELKAQINPFDFDTGCQVQYVEDAVYQSSGYAHATSVPCSPEHLGPSFGDQGAGRSLSGLKVGTTYHYRFLAESQGGSVQGEDKTFITFGVHSLQYAIVDKEGHPYVQAGGHPYELITSFAVNWSENPGGAPHEGNRPFEVLTGNLKDVVTKLPAGLVGDPEAAAKCTRADLRENRCPAAAQIGLAQANITSENGFPFPKTGAVGIYNLVPPKGVAAEFGFFIYELAEAFIDARLKSDGDYGVTAEGSNTSTVAGVADVFVHFWGVPGDPSHDEWRYCPNGSGGLTKGCATSVAPKPFLRNPTSCPGLALSTTFAFDSWQAPGAFDEQTVDTPPITGCGEVPFAPTLQLQPTTTEADTPTGLHVDLHLPQNDDPEGLAEADLKDTTVTLPQGLSTNASAANGLQACSPAQVGLTSALGATPVTFTPDPAGCPDAAKVGTVEVDTVELDHPLLGAVYIATPYDNAFGSLLAIYIAIYDEQTGVVIKLAGHVEPNPETGQLTTTFSESPQLPFKDVKLDFFAGPRAALATPEGCGSYTTAASLTPWSSPPVPGSPPVPVSPPMEPFSISSGCVSGFSPSFSAGTTVPQAGAFTPLSLSLSRADTDQELSGLSVTLPRGLVGKLAGVGLCSETQLAAAAADSGAGEVANPSCPATSQIGTVQAGSGAGGQPLFLSGKAYLTGPYNGGPYGIAVIVPALAGPFDLGTVVVRSSLRIDRHSAQVTAVSDPFPTILKGIPIRLRRVDVNIDRLGFALNPTSCNPAAVTATLSSTAGASAAVSQRFQVGGCPALHFKPHFSASTQAKTSKANGASLDVKVAQGPGEANIAKVDVSLPLALPSRLSTLQKACPASQFEANPAGCPAGSIVGSASARTPLLASPLSGPAYLVSHGGAAFPDLVLLLQGEGIKIELVGSTNIKRGITYSRFDTVPDAPISAFELKLPAGPHSILATNLPTKAKGSLCSSKLVMPVTITAQNGAQVRQSTKVAVAGCPKHHKARRHRRRGRHRRGGHRTAAHGRR